MEKLYTKKEVASYLRVSVRTIDRLIAKMDIPIYSIGRQIRIPESSQQLLLKKNSMTQKDRQDLINKIYGG
jgi:excisionase family DNA binding protein|tara:strand:- start:1285 stop:1497 length:213 start_codon:yes stop_codon:yes gene_type:complete